MSDATSLLVKDDAATPSELTLLPITTNPTPFWRGNAANVPIDGQPRLTASWEKLKNGSYKATAKLEVPVMEVLGDAGSQAGYVAAPKVAYVDTGIFTMFADIRSTVADRANLLKLMVGLLQGASSTTATGTLDQGSSGDAFKSSTAPFPTLFINGVMPT
jgi:hypothetical protein